jgi:hypothetical protein
MSSVSDGDAEQTGQSESADERLPSVDGQLDDLVGLQRPDDPREHPEHTTLGTGRHQPRRWGLGEQTSIAGPLGSPKDRNLSFETEDRAVYVGFAAEDTGVVDQVAGGEIVRPVDHDVVARQYLHGVARVETDIVGHQLDKGVDIAQALQSDFELAPPNIGFAVEDLTLKIRLVDPVEVDHSEPADSGGGQVHGEW